MTDTTDDIIDQLLASGETNNDSSRLDDVPVEAVPSDQNYNTERLVSLAAGGQAELYIGKAYSIDMIEGFQESTIIKLYSRCEARFCAIMTKTQGKSALELASILAANFLPFLSKTGQG